MVTRTIAQLYSLRRLKKIFRQLLKRYQKKRYLLSPFLREKVAYQLSALQTAIQQKDLSTARPLAQQLQQIAQESMAKTRGESLFDLVRSIGGALLIAIVIRQMWFELYTIPTGSMRPTLKESDFLVVSKATYGLNIPLQTDHFYFAPWQVKRGDIVVFTAENMNVADADTTYFYLFHGKKQFVKRLLGKPGDTLYFYGGKIYGITNEDRELRELLEAPWAESLEHIPFLRFEGEVQYSYPNNWTLHQMQKPVATLHKTPLGSLQGTMIAGPKEGEYSDLWGIEDFAMARLLTQEEGKNLYPDKMAHLPAASLYLELTHHPSLQQAKYVGQLQLGHHTSLLPLQDSHVQKIAQNLTTARFHVKNQVAFRLGMEKQDGRYSPYFPSIAVPDGTYEIEKGVAYEILFGGIAKELPPSHPLYPKTAQEVQLLYNLGIEFLTHYQPSHGSTHLPSRYAYFRDHDLYLLNAPILDKEDETLIRFLRAEYERQALSTTVHPYHPFDDPGPPVHKDGSYDVDFLRTHGLTVPDNSYLVLGDNHAMSGDSRVFGFVPQENLKGTVSFLFSPPGKRWGLLLQPIHSLFTLPLFCIALAVIVAWRVSSWYHRKKLLTPISIGTHEQEKNCPDRG